MLVLSRKVGERIIIGDGIVISVNRIANNRVTLGISAPADVRVIRAELADEAAAPCVDRPDVTAADAFSSCAG